MADRLSQLQASVDQLVTQFFSALNYINQHHDFAPLHGEPKVEDAQLEVADAPQFEAALRELARDIAVKAQQIETLIDSLPGLDTSERDQLDAIGRLDGELQAARAERREVLAERKRLLDQCNDLIVRITQEKIGRHE